MVITAIGLFFNIDRKFQTLILNAFPNYGVGLTKLEDNDTVKKELEKINSKNLDQSKIGKPMFDIALPKGPRAPEIIPGGEWFNLETNQPLKLSDLRGKVVLIDFWTYSCINCQRTFPYLRNWWEKYKDKGLVIIGVHSPEFEFEKNKNNVKKAIDDFGLKYPIVQDNDFATWRAYNNQYWPAKYFIDKDGYIRYTHFGEGAYDESEKVIQELLKEAGTENLSGQINNPEYQIYSKTPETYLGLKRINNFASPEKITLNKLTLFTTPKTIPNNRMSFEGNWTVSEEYASPEKGAKLYFNFDAKEVFLVMKPKTGNAKVRVFVDEKQTSFGEDNKDGLVTVEGDKLYKLIKLETPGRHILKLEFEDGNAQLFAFTFG